MTSPNGSTAAQDRAPASLGGGRKDAVFLGLFLVAGAALSIWAAMADASLAPDLAVGVLRLGVLALHRGISLGLRMRGISPSTSLWSTAYFPLLGCLWGAAATGWALSEPILSRWDLALGLMLTTGCGWWCWRLIKGSPPMKYRPAMELILLIVAVSPMLFAFGLLILWSLGQIAAPFSGR